MTHILRALAVPMAVAATLALTSCGSTAATPASKPTASAKATASGTQSPVGPPAVGESNTEDVNFASAMITDHLQANLIADLAARHAKNAKIKALAPQIEKAHGPEVTTMAGWLVGGGQPVPDAKGGGHDMGSMPGMEATTHVMITPEEMTTLGKATGSKFDRTWLQLMLKHHQSAVSTARTEVAKGVNPGAKQLAQTIIDRQSNEIATMKSILAEVSSS